MKKVVIVLLLISGASYAQDGKIVSRTRIDDFDGFIKYILDTETLDPVIYDTSRYRKFDPERYHLLKEVEVFGITYLSDGLKVKGFLLQPKKEGKFPAIIYNRGGSLEHGSLTHFVSSIGLGELARLANAGFVVVAGQYRGNGGGEGREEYGGADLNDVINLFALLKNEPKADETKLGMFGWSRGGMTTFLTLKRLAKEENFELKAVAVGAPSINLTRSSTDRPLLDEWWSTFIPDYNTPMKYEILKRRSAIFWVDELPKDVPLLILHGTDDRSTSAEENLKFVAKVQEQGIPYRYIMYELGDHGLSEHREEVFHQLIRWFNVYLN